MQNGTGVFSFAVLTEGGTNEKSNPLALLPIGVFLVIYLGLGLLFEYGLHIYMGFYNIPIVVAFLIALLVACLQTVRFPLMQAGADGSGHRG